MAQLQFLNFGLLPSNSPHQHQNLLLQHFTAKCSKLIFLLNFIAIQEILWVTGSYLFASASLSWIAFLPIDILQRPNLLFYCSCRPFFIFVVNQYIWLRFLKSFLNSNRNSIFANDFFTIINSNALTLFQHHVPFHYF